MSFYTGGSDDYFRKLEKQTQERWEIENNIHIKESEKNEANADIKENSVPKGKIRKYIQRIIGIK